MTDQNQNNSYVDSYSPPTPAASAAPTPSAPMPTQPPASSTSSAPASDTVSQSLEDQNIFDLLGVQDATDEEKEGFLDELQQVIWEDFLENDVELLITQEELVEFKKISDRQDISEEDRQNNMIDFLEKLIPDLEKIMLEKALELKEEMMRERVNELLQLNAQKPDILAKVQHAQTLMNDQRWRDAADELNSIQ